MSTAADEETRAGEPTPELPPASPVPDSPVRRRARWRIAVAVAVVVAVVAGLTWVIGFSSVLAVRTVRVVGAHRLDPAAVRAAARIEPDEPLIRVPRVAVERRIEALPAVAAARIDLSFPNTVIIRITERVASGYRRTSAGSWTLVDGTGRSFGVLDRAPTDLPELAPAADVAADPATLAALAGVAAAVPATVRRHLRQLTATGPDAVLLVLSDQRTVLWGASSENAEKARVLPALLKRPGTSFDISNPALVVAR